jgi:hypothetical protein
MESSLIEEECKKQSGNCMSVSICLIMVNGLGELIADLYVLSANRYHWKEQGVVVKHTLAAW